MVKKVHVAAFIVGAVIAFLSIVLVSMLGENNIEAMKSVVDTDAALIGFLAVATVFLLTQTSGDRKRALDDIAHLEEMHREKCGKGLSDDSEYLQFKKERSRLAYFAGFCSAFSNLAVWSSLVSATFFVASILMALLGMSNDPLAKSVGVTISIFAMVFGIVTIFYVLSAYRDFQSKYEEAEFVPERS